MLITIVLDASESVERAMPLGVKATEEFLKTADPADEFAVATIRSRPELSLGSVRSPETVLRRMGDIDALGQTARLDSIYLTANYLRPRGSTPGRRLWWSQTVEKGVGVDRASYARQADDPAYSSPANMPQPRSAGRLLLALTLCSSSAIDAYGWSSASFLHPSIRQEEEIMSFVAWVGLAAGFIGSQRVKRREKGILPDLLLGVVGAVAGGWLFYAFGPPGKRT
jgi:hypothetical protein